MCAADIAEQRRGASGGRLLVHNVILVEIERVAGDFFLRIHAKGDLTRKLTPDEWSEFRRNGGTTYDG